MANEVIPEALRRRYVDSFPAKGAALEASIEALDVSGEVNAEALSALRQQAHKLAGSAGMYGFDDLGHLARELVHAIDAGAKTPIIDGLARDLASRLVGARAALDI
jgi:HPt (histidine-containing phosphotransfer) domain-containing protein